MRRQKSRLLAECGSLPEWAETRVRGVRSRVSAAVQYLVEIVVDPEHVAGEIVHDVV